MAGYLLNDFKSSQPNELEFRRGAYGLDMSAEEPNFIPDFVYRGM